MICYLILLIIVYVKAEIWEQDMTSDMKIGLSTTGYQKVDLRCGYDYFSVNVTLDDDFDGIVYTRGSYNDKKLPCFKSHNQHFSRGKGKLLIGLRIPFDECNTVMDVAESRYTNTLIIQHDQELIMPGDAAFSLDCAFTPEFKLSSDVTTKDPKFVSKISLVDADPASEKSTTNSNYTVESNTEKVSFSPKKKTAKDEL